MTNDMICWQRLVIHLLVVGSTEVLMAEQEFTQGRALLIGVGTYADAAIPTVSETTVDAQAVAQVLLNPAICGYPSSQVMTLTDAAATRTRILAALDALATESTAETVLFLFFSGHGDYGADGGYYLLSHDARVRWIAGKAAVEPGTGLSQRELLQRLKAIPARRMLLVFNACHSGQIAPALGSSSGTLGQALPTATTTALLATGAGNVIITACLETQVSYIGPGPRTIFGQALLEGLQGTDLPTRDGYISVFDLYNYLYFTVHSRVQRLLSKVQEPELSIVKGVGPLLIARAAAEAKILGPTAPPDQPVVGTRVREIPASESVQMYQQLVGGGSAPTQSPGNAHQEGVVSTGIMGNLQTGGGTQITVGSIMTEGGGVAVGGDIYDHRKTISGPVPLAGPDEATRLQIKQLLNQLAEIADKAELARGTRATIVTQAEAAIQALEVPEPPETLHDRIAAVVQTVQSISEGVAAASPLYAIAKSLARLVGIELP